MLYTSTNASGYDFKKQIKKKKNSNINWWTEKIGVKTWIITVSLVSFNSKGKEKVDVHDDKQEIISLYE